MERKDILTSLAQRMAKLPTVTRRVLAMYYYENMRILDIATCFGLPESRICQIHIQAVESLRTFFTTLKVEQMRKALPAKAKRSIKIEMDLDHLTCPFIHIRDV